MSGNQKTGQRKQIRAAKIQGLGPSHRENQVTSWALMLAALNPPRERNIKISGWLEYQRKWLWEAQDAAQFLFGELGKTEKALAEKTELLSSLTTEVELRQQLRETQAQLEVAQQQLEDECETNTRLMGEISRHPLQQLQQSQNGKSVSSQTVEAAKPEPEPELDILGRPPHPSLVGGQIFC